MVNIDKCRRIRSHILHCNYKPDSVEGFSLAVKQLVIFVPSLNEDSHLMLCVTRSH